MLTKELVINFSFLFAYRYSIAVVLTLAYTLESFLQSFNSHLIYALKKFFARQNNKCSIVTILMFLPTL